MSSIVRFVAYGVAQPKGSTRAFMPKGARYPVVTSDNPRLKDWQHAIADAARAAGVPFVAEGAITLHAAFWLPRPKSLPKRVSDHTKRPDLDKLLRAVKDALTAVAWQDDSQVTEVQAVKRYADGSTGQERPCVAVTIMTHGTPREVGAEGGERE